MVNKETLRDPLASAVADVFFTAGELRLATLRATEAQRRRGADSFSLAMSSPWQQARLANDHVRELTEHIAYRAARDEIDLNDLLAACEAVAKGRALLPAGVEILEAA